jgi:outer membrane biosynthesis protein TonB
MDKPHKLASHSARRFPAIWVILSVCGRVALVAACGLTLTACKSKTAAMKSGPRIMYATTSKGTRSEAKPRRRESPTVATIARKQTPDKPPVASDPQPYKPELADTQISKPGHSPTQIAKNSPSPQPEPSKTSPTAGPDPVKSASSEGSTSPDTAKTTDPQDSSKGPWKINGARVVNDK